jgi:hypothetical protein
VKAKERGKLDLNFSEQNVGKIRYHQPCHLKAQNIGFKAQELCRSFPAPRSRACSAAAATTAAGA